MLRPPFDVFINNHEQKIAHRSVNLLTISKDGICQGRIEPIVWRGN